MKNLDYVFWGAPLQGRPFEDQIRAAAAGRFTSLAVESRAVHEAHARGIRLPEMKRQAADAGVPFRHYHSLATWALMRLSLEQLGTKVFDRWTTTVDEALDIRSELDLKCVLLDSGFLKGTGVLPPLRATLRRARLLCRTRLSRAACGGCAPPEAASSHR